MEARRNSFVHDSVCPCSYVMKMNLLSAKAVWSRKQTFFDLSTPQRNKQKQREEKKILFRLNTQELPHEESTSK